MCWSSAAHTLDTHRIMHALLALVIALAAPALRLASPRDRIGFEREIASSVSNAVAKVDSLILSDSYLASQKNRGKLITRPRPDDNVIEDDVILESNVLNIVNPSETKNKDQVSGPALVRQRRGYNLENVRVPARYPYLPVPNYNRFRRWG